MRKITQHLHDGWSLARLFVILLKLNTVYQRIYREINENAYLPLWYCKCSSNSVREI